MKITGLLASKYARCLFYRRGSRPLEVQIELTNQCNFNCDMCPRHHLNTPERNMTQDTFDKVLAGIEGVREVILTGWGEPLIHPQFFDFAGQIKETYPSVLVRFTTNGCLLDEPSVQKVVALDIDSVSISMDSLKDTGGHGHRKPSEVAENVRRLVKARGRRSRPEVVLQATINRGGAKDLEDIVRFGSEAGVNRLNLVRLITTFDPDLPRPDEQEEISIIRATRQLGAQLGLEVVSINDPNLAMRWMTHDDKLCIKSVYHAYITVDGDVTPCCNLRNEVMGSLLNESMKSIWNNGSFDRFYRNQNQICETCDNFKQRQINSREKK